MLSAGVWRTIAAVGTLLLPLIAVSFFVPFYRTNDDVAMRLLAEGTFIPESGPVPFLMHINVGVGLLLGALYEALPSLPWYDLLLGASMVAGVAGFVCSASGIVRTGRHAAWIAVFALFFVLPAFVHVQFSIVAMTCAGGGVGLIVSASTIPVPARSAPRLLAGVLLIVWGSLVRFEAAALAILQGGLLALPFLAATVRRPELRGRLRRLSLATLAAVALAALGFAANLYAYRASRDWNEFLHFNYLRSRVTEYLPADRLTGPMAARLFAETGWTANDLLLFQRWFITDSDRYSYERLKKAERLLSSARPTPRSFAATLLAGAKGYLVLLWRPLVLLFLFALSWQKRKLLLLYMVHAIAATGALILLITIFAKAPPDRIVAPMLMLTAAALAAAAIALGGDERPRLAVVCMIIAAALTTEQLRSMHQQNVQRRANAAEARADVEGLLHATRAPIYVLHGAAFPYEDFWRPLRSQKKPFEFLPLGVSARSPMAMSYLRRTGRGDLPRALCSDPAMVLIAREEILPLLTRFSLEHHSSRVRYERVFQGKQFAAWRCRPEDDKRVAG